MERINKLFTSKIFRILFLLLLWIGLTVWSIVTFDTSFSLWSYNHNKGEIDSLNFGLIDKGDVIRGEFISQDNNLGIISVRFQTYIRPPYKYEDQLLFRLKEKRSDKWYYESTYRSGLIYDIPFFPFGFPQISDSKGKVYQFEISSLNRNKVNGISIKNKFPIFQSKYKYNKNELLQDIDELAKFLIIKFTNAFKTPDILFASFTYLLPLIFYILWVLFLEKPLNQVIKKVRKFVFSLKKTKVGYSFNVLSFPFQRFDNIIILVVLLDILFFQVQNTLVYLTIVVLWIRILNVYTKSSAKSFIVGILLLLFCAILLLFDLGPTAENSAAWAFLFLSSGTIREMFNKNN